jgi:hypothetical protein
MKLRVITADGTQTYEGYCRVESGGVLKITQANSLNQPDPSKPIIRLSPAFWREVHEGGVDRGPPPSGRVRT